MNVRERIPKKLHAEELIVLARIAQADILDPYLTRRLTKSGNIVQVSIVATALQNESGQIYAISTTERIINGAPQ